MTGDELIEEIRKVSEEVCNGKTRGELTLAGYDAWDQVAHLVALANKAVKLLEASYVAMRGVERLRQQVAFLLQYTEGAEQHGMLVMEDSILDGIDCNVCGTPLKGGCACRRREREECSKAANRKNEDDGLWWTLVEVFGISVDEVFAMNPETRSKLSHHAGRMRVRGML